MLVFAKTIESQHGVCDYQLLNDTGVVYTGDAPHGWYATRVVRPTSGTPQERSSRVVRHTFPLDGVLALFFG
jgi:hypothetical protein